jgi:DNA mismatch repair protein MutS
MIFLRKIVPGATDDSFGIEVAKLAGLPNSVVSRARQILAQLEEDGAPAPTHVVKQQQEDPQITMLELGSQQVCAALQSMSVETLTPIEAMNELYKLKKMLD